MSSLHPDGSFESECFGDITMIPFPDGYFEFANGSATLLLPSGGGSRAIENNASGHPDSITSFPAYIPEHPVVG